MSRWWADTLFKRLFLLMWFGLVASHLIAFQVVTSLYFPSQARPPTDIRFPVLPSLPPAGLGSGSGPVADLSPRDGPGSAGPGQPPDRSAGPPGNSAAKPLLPTALWLDYGIRFLAIGVVAWFGARWLSTPMRRLAAASEALGAHNPPTLLDASRGTLEVQRTAQVFNAMASRLHSQFGAQALLMAAISHDLRTPLARLRLRLEAMAPGPQTERSIADVHEMDALIGGALELLREQQAPADPVRVDVAMLVQALVDDLADQGRPATFAELSPVSPPGSAPPLVSAASSVLKRMVGNLIGNALQHGGSARIRVEAGAHWVRVVVDDDGPGIPAAQLGAVFEPFRRGASKGPGETLGAGYGLGLYIARDLAERVGGAIVLGNRPEGGLRATLQLPVAAPDRPSPAHPPIDRMSSR